MSRVDLEEYLQHLSQEGTAAAAAKGIGRAGVNYAKNKLTQYKKDGFKSKSGEGALSAGLKGLRGKAP